MKLIIVSICSFFFFQIISMHSSKKENNIILKDLVSMAQEISTEMVVNKDKLPENIIKELEYKLKMAYFATYDPNLQLGKLHRYLKNACDCLQEKLKIINNTQ